MPEVTVGACDILAMSKHRKVNLSLNRFGGRRWLVRGSGEGWERKEKAHNKKLRFEVRCAKMSLQRAVKSNTVPVDPQIVLYN